GGIGIGCPGSINSRSGICCFSGNLGWNNAPVAEMIRQATGLPTKVTNDANAAMLGEAKFGVGKQYNNLVLLTLGTGVGGGLFLDGKLYEGNEGKGTELGHMVIERGGRQCTCGLKGCLEAYASVTALISDTKKAMKKDKDSKMWDFVKGDIKKVDGRTSFECAKKGDKTALKVVDDYEEYLTLGIINFCNIFRPEAVILSGGLSNQRKYLTDAVEKKLAAKDYGFKRTPEVKVLVSALGSDAGIVGAAALFIA
nr:ROK family protein [Bacilli bacterium]